MIEKKKLVFTTNLKFYKKKNINNVNVFKSFENKHIFFCEGLILLKKIRNKFKLSYFDENNELFNYINHSVYIGSFKKKNIYAHNISKKKTASNLDQIDFFKNKIKKEDLSKIFFCDLRKVFLDLSIKDSYIAGVGKSIINWKVENSFCPKCGEKFLCNDFKWENKCINCNKINFARVNPVVIIIIISGKKTLLGRSYHFPDKLYSCLAGFVEPGETLEMAAIREIKEEVGIKITNIKYITNQPWPFPSSLMFGLIAKTTNKNLKIDKKEIEHAFWITKSKLRKILNGKTNKISAARKGTIARYLLENWVNNKI